jgi:hypothetical protein
MSERFNPKFESIVATVCAAATPAAASLLVDNPGFMATLPLITASTGAATKGGKLSYTLGSAITAAAATEVSNPVQTGVLGLATIALTLYNIRYINRA